MLTGRPKDVARAGRQGTIQPPGVRDTLRDSAAAAVDSLGAAASRRIRVDNPRRALGLGLTQEAVA
jgi:hypothetical protein